MTDPQARAAREDADPTPPCPKCGGPRVRDKGSNGAARCRRCENERRRERRRIAFAARLAAVVLTPPPEEVSPRDRLGWTSDQDLMEAGSEAVPCPDEILRRCREIQKEWSPRERARRAGCFGRQANWTPPRGKLAEMVR